MKQWVIYPINRRAQERVQQVSVYVLKVKYLAWHIFINTLSQGSTQGGLPGWSPPRHQKIEI
jgi:hypothetical protein